MEHVAEQLRQIAAVVDPSEWGSVCIQDGSSVRVSLVRDAPGGPGPRFRTRFSGSRAWSARRHGAGPRWARPQAAPAQHVDVRRAAGVATAAGVDARQPAQQSAPRTAPTARKRRWLITAFTRSWSARRIQTVYRPSPTMGELQLLPVELPVTLFCFRFLMGAVKHSRIFCQLVSLKFIPRLVFCVIGTRAFYCRAA